MLLFVDFFQYIYGSADCLRENGETDKALALLEPWRDSIRIFEWEQTLSKILWLDGMAKCYIKTKHFDKAIELNVGDTKLAKHNRGICSYFLNDKENACKDWQAASEISIDFLSKYCNGN